MTWETIAAELKFSNPYLSVVVERVRTPTREREWTTVQRKNAVVIAAITAESKIVLINQERISIRAAIWEMPAGQIDDSTDQDGKNAGEVALRELREETGYELAPGGELIALGDFFSSPGFTDEREFLFAARPAQLSAAGHAQEESEAIHDCREFSVAEINRMIADNTIRDANTLSTWARLLARKIIALPPT
ncbi:MAG: ADP-ribose pyrophosphatase [Verrucomicrobiota bacterium]